ncbi:hypothetical protein BCR39DRAFT_19454 [Naematelia encephala]|uniref:Uncharacterized protein n=1 Tax=Naematelia encephala TaxID=71784 RepID=A0A1Y2BLA4_9TREE|nr:hypothetical protein BCR39DRAFT_19454 [Naematelia encephala]
MSYDPFSDNNRTQRTRFVSPSPIPSPSPSPTPSLAQPEYPPQSYTNINYEDGSGDVGYGGPAGGVDINGQHVPWSGGDEDEETKPLTSGSPTPFLASDPYGRPPSVLSSGSGADFIRRQTIPKRGATTRRVKLTNEGNWVNEYPVPRPILTAVEPKWLSDKSTEFR